MAWFYQECLRRCVQFDIQWIGWKRTDDKHIENDKSNYKFRGPIPPLFFIQKDANQMEYKQPEPRLKLHDLASSQMKPVMKPDHWLFIKHEKPLCFKCFLIFAWHIVCILTPGIHNPTPAPPADAAHLSLKCPGLTHYPKANTLSNGSSTIQSPTCGSHGLVEYKTQKHIKHIPNCISARRLRKNKQKTHKTRGLCELVWITSQLRFKQ